MEACFVHPHGYIVRQQLCSHCLSTTVYFQPCKYILKRCIKTIHLSTSVVEVIPHGVNNISLSFRQHAQSKSPNLNHHQPSIMHIGLPLIQGECLRWANTNTAAAPTQNTSNLSKQSNCHSCRYTFNPDVSQHIAFNEAMRGKAESAVTGPEQILKTDILYVTFESKFTHINIQSLSIHL